MKTIDRKLIERFVRRAADLLSGDWVIIGGTVLPLLGRDYRVTQDIDCVSCDDAPQSETLKLMEIAEELGLPVEAINQAGAYFLKKVPHFEKRLVEVATGKKGRILRPDLGLFLELKIARLSESDLQDCLEFIGIEKTISKDVFAVVARAKRKAAHSGEALARLEQLELVLSRFAR